MPWQKDVLVFGCSEKTFWLQATACNVQAECLNSIKLLLCCFEGQNIEKISFRIFQYIFTS